MNLWSKHTALCSFIYFLFVFSKNHKKKFDLKLILKKKHLKDDIKGNIKSVSPNALRVCNLNAWSSASTHMTLASKPTINWQMKVEDIASFWSYRKLRYKKEIKPVHTTTECSTVTTDDHRLHPGVTEGLFHGVNDALPHRCTARDKTEIKFKEQHGTLP